MITSQVAPTQSVPTPPAPTPPNTSKWCTWHTLSLLCIIAAIALDGILVPLEYRVWVWVGTLAFLALFAAIAGHGVTGCWRGPLIDERNKISLSRLQATLWTLLILATLLAAALTNIRNGQANPLDIAIPTGLWILMGISATSLVGSPLVLSNKKNRSANDDQTKRTLALLDKQNVNVDQVINVGQVIANVNPKNARWADLFIGEETGNAAHFDLGKIQMFYFTLILFLVYAVAVAILFLGPVKIIRAFPDMDASILTLLSISHATYLTNKAIPHSDNQSDVPQSIS